MYQNIGKKIKLLAKIIFFIFAMIGFLGGLVLFMAGNGEGLIVIIGLLIMIIIPLIAWISSWLLYGFGELIDKACDIEKNTRIYNLSTKQQPKSELSRTEKLERLRSQGLITEEEYQMAISK